MNDWQEFEKSESEYDAPKKHLYEDYEKMSVHDHPNLDSRINDITKWYNDYSAEFEINKKDFYEKHTGTDGKLNLNNIRDAIEFGQLLNRDQVIRQVFSMLVNDPTFLDIPDDISGIDKV